MSKEEIEKKIIEIMVKHGYWNCDSSNAMADFVYELLNKANKERAINFAMWFAVNWEWHDDTENGTTYLSVYDGKTIRSIEEIYENWLISCGD
jgi:hypothetical protein